MSNRPAVIDLFAGVGGFSLGAARAGFDIRAAVELDQRPLKAHSRNFTSTVHLQQDVSKLTAKSLLSDAGLTPGVLNGLIGGPPCQGFSAMGKNELDDPRNTMVFHFCRLVSEMLPSFFVFENVPGILHDRYRELLERAFTEVPQRYTVLAPIRINARERGVPTNRVRVFFIGFDSDRVRCLAPEDFATPADQPIVKVRDALFGLPKIRSHWSSAEESLRRVEKPNGSAYNERIVGLVPPGVGDPEALRLYQDKDLVSGCSGTVHTKETVSRFARLKPGDVDPISKARRLDRNGFCPTLRAGTGPDRGSFQAVRPIHPGSPRVITPREAARLQGFPDWFQFDHTKWHAFRQIGNSVSPIVAESILKTLRSALGD
jgi:DNA (cytosine-5)-methyltransferase 1